MKESLGEARATVPSWVKRSGTSKNLLAATPVPVPTPDLEDRKHRLSRLFDVIDINGDGDVTVAELITSFRFCCRNSVSCLAYYINIVCVVAENTRHPL